MSESSDQDRIVCRQCGENISVRTGNCPHCGTSVRSGTRLLGSIALGILIVLVSIYGIFFADEGGLWFFALIGIVMIIVGYVFYSDRRSRVQEATQEEEA